MLDSMPYFIADRRGVFRSEGLVCDTVASTGAEVGLPRLLAGDIDFLFGNYVSIVNACARRAPIRVIADGSIAAHGVFGVVALPTSGIHGPKDLGDKRIGVNTRRNMATALVATTLRAHNVSGDDVRYVPIPFPAMQTALRHHRIDAAFLPEPFLIAAQERLGAMSVLDPIDGPTANLPMDGYVTTVAFLRRYPCVVAAFRRAIQHAARLSALRRQLVRTEVAMAMHVGRDLLAVTALPEYPTELSAGRLQRVADLMLTQGLLRHRLDMRAFIAAPTG